MYNAAEQVEQFEAESRLLDIAWLEGRLDEYLARKYADQRRAIEQQLAEQRASYAADLQRYLDTGAYREEDVEGEDSSESNVGTAGP